MIYDPLVEIKNSLIYLSCMMLHNPLPDVGPEAMDSFMRGNLFVFPNGCAIHLVKGKVKVFEEKETIKTKIIHKVLFEHDDLVNRINYFVHEFWKYNTDLFSYYVENSWEDMKFYEDVACFLIKIREKREKHEKNLAKLRMKRKKMRDKKREAKMALASQLEFA